MPVDSPVSRLLERRSRTIIARTSLAALTVVAVTIGLVEPAGLAMAATDDRMENLGVFQPQFFAELQDAEIVGDLAYIFGVGGLVIIDISDPANPMLLGRYEPPGHPFNRFYRGAAESGVAVGGGREDRLSIVSVVNPGSPGLTAVHGEPGTSYEGAAIRGIHVFAARHGDGVEVVDVTAPFSPVTAGEVTTLTNAWDVDFAGEAHLLVADGAGGLAVLDISDPTAPVHVASVPTSGSAVDVAAMVDDLAIVACGSAGIDVFAVADPTTPVLLGTANTSGLAITVKTSGRTVFVADWDDVEIFDLTNPAQPEPVGRENTPVRAMGLAVADDLVVVTDWSRLRTYRFGPTMQGDIDVSVAGIAFGAVPVGASMDTSFTVANTGGGTVTVSSIQTFNENFTIGSETSFALAPGASREVEVSFFHATPGYDATFLRIDSDDSDESIVNLPLSADDNPSRLDIGDPAPGFVLQDMGGVLHDLDDYRGRVVVLAFFANW